MNRMHSFENERDAMNVMCLRMNIMHLLENEYNAVNVMCVFENEHDALTEMNMMC